MHPVIGIVCFFVFGAYVAFGDAAKLITAFLILTIVYISSHPRYIDSGWKSIRRLRWLFLSIFIIYLWFTPGRPLVSDYANILPTVEGVQLGLLRIASLIVIVLAVNVLVRSISRGGLIASILWLSKPINLIGIPNERLAVRIALTLEDVDKVQSLYAQRIEKPIPAANNLNNSYSSRLSHRLTSIGVVAHGLFSSVIQAALDTVPQQYSLHEQSPPPVIQWCYPVLLLLVFQFSHHIVDELVPYH